MIISNYTVDTTPAHGAGFVRCWWPATNLREARKLARELSLRLANDKRYGNAFWVVKHGAKDKSVCKYWNGEEYAPSTPL